MEKVTDLTARLAVPIVEEQGCSLWDVEYVKEAGTWYLRVLIDKEGGVDILDCENISRALSDLLDEADPIEGSYTLEVGSAGAERVLKRPADFQRYLNSPVLVKLYKPVDGRKEYPGTLTAYNEADGSLTVDLKVRSFLWHPHSAANEKPKGESHGKGHRSHRPSGGTHRGRAGLLPVGRGICEGGRHLVPPGPH